MISTGWRASSSSIGVLPRLAPGLEIPSCPSRSALPPQHPISPPETMNGLFSRSRPAICGADEPPSFAAGIRPGSTWAKQPSSVSNIRKQMIPRAPHAAGSLGLTIDPFGAFTLIARI